MKFRKLSLELLFVTAVLALGLCSGQTLGRQTVLAQDQAIIEAPKDLAGYKAMETRVKEVVAKVLPAVVGIRVGGASGSGVIVSEDGIVMTAGHVVGKPGQDVTFIFHDGKTAKGKTLGMSMPTDVGLMKITDPGKWPVAPQGDSDTVKPGAWCV
ncbi:MAG: S1C family serine protease, partial [Planctomycetes bacterium]|nr:S1C family serine protease [Planctomycetota bacterium]